MATPAAFAFVLASAAACTRNDGGAMAGPAIVPPGLDVEIAYSTYLGSGGGTLRAVVADAEGNVYVAGGTGDRGWTTTLGPSFRGGNHDVVVAKLDERGRVVWSRLLGGPDEDYAYVAALSDSGELTIGGRAGRDFPTTEGAFERAFQGGEGEGPHPPSDGFVARLSPDGEILWSTYIGSEGEDNVRAIHLLPDGRVIVGSGNSTGSGLPTDRGRLGGTVLKPEPGGVKDSWVGVLAADGSSVDFLTYFGPSDDRDPRQDETLRALGADREGNIWIGGTTSGSDLETTPDAFQRQRGSPRGTGEAYVAKLSSDGRRLVYFSWFGGKGNDSIETEGVTDSRGAFYVAGATASADFPTTEGAFQRVLRGGGSGRFDGDGFVARIEPNGRLGMATLYGGSTGGPESFFGPAVDPDGNVWATGRMRSGDCTVTANAFRRRKAGARDSQDAVVVAFGPDGGLLYASYLGGTGVDHGRHVATRPGGGGVYVVGETTSSDFPLRTPSNPNPAGTFVSAFRFGPRAPEPEEPAAPSPEPE